MKRIALIFLLLSLVATAAVAFFAVPIWLTLDLLDQKVCAVYGFGECGDTATIDAEISVSGLFFDDILTFTVNGRTRGLERHYRTLLKDGRIVGKIAGRNVRLYFPEPPEITANGSNFDVHATIDPSGIGVKPRRTRIVGNIEPIVVELTLGFFNFSPAPEGYCGPHSAFKNLPKRNFTVPGIKLTLKIDDVPGRIDRSFAADAMADARGYISVPLANLVALGFHTPSLEVYAQSETNVDFQFTINLPKNKVTDVVTLIHPRAKDRWFPAFMALGFDILRDSDDSRGVVAKNLALLFDRESAWPLVDAADRGWGCRITSGSRQGQEVMPP